MQLLPSRHLNPWRVSFRAALLRFYASNVPISITPPGWRSGEHAAETQLRPELPGDLCESLHLSALHLFLSLSSRRVLWDYEDLPKDSQCKKDEVRSAGQVALVHLAPSLVSPRDRNGCFRAS